MGQLVWFSEHFPNFSYSSLEVFKLSQGWDSSCIFPSFPRDPANGIVRPTLGIVQRKCRCLPELCDSAEKHSRPCTYFVIKKNFLDK